MRQMDLKIAFQAVGKKEDDDDRGGNETHTQKQRKIKYTYHIQINILPAIYKVYIYKIHLKLRIHLSSICPRLGRCGLSLMNALSSLGNIKDLLQEETRVMQIRGRPGGENPASQSGVCNK